MDAQQLKTVKRKNKIKGSKTDYVYYAICGFILFLLAVIVIYPLYYIVIASISDPDAVMTGDVWLYPIDITFSGFAQLFNRDDIWRGYFNTLAYTVLGTAFNVVLTIPAGWALSRDYLPFRKIIMPILIVTMFFGGGLVPTFLVMRMLGLLNSYFVYILPGLYSVYNMIIICNFFRGIPEELHEAAVMDGASETRIFSTIYLPLSKPVIATVALWVGIGHWNSFFDCMIYITDVRTLDSLQTLQYYLLQVINSSTLTEGMPPEQMERISSKTISMAAILVAIVPLFFAFPLIKRNFNSGIMIGSLKG